MKNTIKIVRALRYSALGLVAGIMTTVIAIYIIEHIVQILRNTNG